MALCVSGVVLGAVVSLGVAGLCLRGATSRTGTWFGKEILTGIVCQTVGLAENVVACEIMGFTVSVNVSVTDKI